MQRKHPSDEEKNDRGDQDVDRRSRDRDHELLPGIRRHPFKARDASNGQQSNVGSPNPESLRRECVAKLMQQHAKKDQQRESHSVDRRLQAAFRVVDPGIEDQEQQKGEVDPHLNAGNRRYAIGPFHSSARSSNNPMRQAFSGGRPCPASDGNCPPGVFRARWRQL